MHRSDDVWTLRFDNGDSLGVTANHPVFSATHSCWRPAGERLLSLPGETALASKAKLPGTHTVYNLEVRELHNFLVGDVGVVVHNSYASILNQVKNMSPAQLMQHISDGWSVVIKSSDDVPHFFASRKYFQDLIEEFRYKVAGFKETAVIAENF